MGRKNGFCPKLCVVVCRFGLVERTVRLDQASCRPWWLRVKMEFIKFSVPMSMKFQRKVAMKQRDILDVF